MALPLFERPGGHDSLCNVFDDGKDIYPSEEELHEREPRAGGCGRVRRPGLGHLGVLERRFQVFFPVQQSDEKAQKESQEPSGDAGHGVGKGAEHGFIRHFQEGNFFDRPFLSGQGNFRSGVLGDQFLGADPDQVHLVEEVVKEQGPAGHPRAGLSLRGDGAPALDEHELFIDGLCKWNPAP